ncbi:thioredoxin-like protein 5 [Pseudohyphozyma bogoriensis]|nr:thioredoxin-like protein 5 [Pseudohyphozyma bogoriensis]
MPLLFPPSSTSFSPSTVSSLLPASTSPTTPSYLIFFASIDPATGQSWCIDCRNSVALIEKFLPEKKGNSVLVQVGARNEWKTPENEYRKLYDVQNIPTIVRVEDPNASVEAIKSSKRLVEAEVMDEDKFGKFVA